MHIILGGTGHVGAATATALLARGEAVTIITRDAKRGEALRARGATVAVADVHDVAALREVFKLGRRLFLLNPPAAPKLDTDAEERSTIASILAAIEGLAIEKIVAESTAGAQPGERCGDLNTLYEFEQGLRRQRIPTSVIRAAYYFSNWDAMLPIARSDGRLPTMFPADLKIPMVAPEDLGAVAARLMTEPPEAFAIHDVEGPARYSATDVAAAFATALGRSVEVLVTPRLQWVEAYRKLGFSGPAAESYARMTGVVVDGSYDAPAAPERGATTLNEYVAALVAHTKSPGIEPTSSF